MTSCLGVAGADPDEEHKAKKLYFDPSCQIRLNFVRYLGRCFTEYGGHNHAPETRAYGEDTLTSRLDTVKLLYNELQRSVKNSSL